MFVKKIKAATLIEINRNRYQLVYESNYQAEPISLALPVEKNSFEFSSFPAFFEGLLPEGIQLEALLRQKKIDKNDFFSQLIAVGKDMVGAVTVGIDQPQ